MMRRHPRSVLVAVLAWLSLVVVSPTPPSGAVALQAVGSGTAVQDVYYPGPGDDWERRSPARVGLDADALEAAIAFASEPERAGWDRDLEAALRLFLAGEPENEIVGPMKPRGPPTGIVIRHGYLVAEWGDPRRVDMTFSVTKSFTSTVAGLAWDRGLIRDLHDPVGHYVPYGHFESEHNSKVTWDHLLRQTSEWQGTLWGKPDWVDRFDGTKREVMEPGTRWRYNDVRVNLLALSLLHVWRRPLPQVLREHVMDPIGASNTWRWHGYENSWITVDGLRMQSVSGGGHWGGGMWISARDLARFGLLWLRQGRWKGRQIVSDAWIELARTPTDLQPTYGFMNWFLNTDGELMPVAPRSAFYHAGAGINRIYVDPEHDLVVVVRWLDGEHFNEFIELLLDTVKG